MFSAYKKSKTKTFSKFPDTSLTPQVIREGPLQGATAETFQNSQSVSKKRKSTTSRKSVAKKTKTPTKNKKALKTIKDQI